MTLLRVAVAVLAAGLTGLIVWAMGAGEGLFVEGGVITGLPWGVVTLADLYLGFILISLVIFLAEPNKLVALAWIVPIFFLGNVWSGLWLVLKAPELARRLT